MMELKIMLLLKKEFSEYYEINRYRLQPVAQMSVKKYAIQDYKIVVG